MITLQPQTRPDQTAASNARVVLATLEVLARWSFRLADDIDDPREASIWTRVGTGAGDLARTTVEELDNLNAEAPPP